MAQRKIYDISIPISESMIVWPGDGKVEISQLSHLSKGDASTVSQIYMGSHTGTHVDAPSHFIAEGREADNLDLNLLTGPALVVDARGFESITARSLEKLSIPRKTKRVLFLTKNSQFWSENESEFRKDFTAITEDGAHWLVSRGIGLIGIDYLSVAPFNNGIPTHKALLGNDVIIVEGLNLSGIEPGSYELVCLPLKISGIDGAPARAILIEKP
ncbi:MAG: cyclase family protein [Deltaproteobacteria bacterium]|nr:cyclase family protein [Deltaproteobacteria bacterium]